MTLKTILLLSAIMVFSSGARPIPNKITADEYALYSEWATQHFAKNPPEPLYFSSRTGVFDPLGAPCDSDFEREGVSTPLIDKLHVLGGAQYPLNPYSAGSLRIPWTYKEVDSAPDLPPGSFHLIMFRV